MKRGNMLKNIVAFAMAIGLCGCAAMQQISQSAANNAKPAAPPVLVQHPSSSALWKDEPTTFHIAGRMFVLNVTSDLFNTLSVKLGGHPAVELPRGSFTDYRPIIQSELAPGQVYFRLSSQVSDANRQTELDLLEIVDKANVLVDVAPVVSIVDLVVGETSINPAYNATPNSYKEAAWKVVLDRGEIGPLGTGGVSRCTFDLESTDPFAGADRGFRAPPGAQVLFQVPSSHCKSIGFLIKGQPTDMVEYPDLKGRIDNHAFMVPADAAVGSEIKFQVLGLDVLRRPSMYDVKVQVKAASAPVSLPCDSNNGFGGHNGHFKFCANCAGNRFNYNGDFCTAADAQTGANNALTLAGYTNCSLAAGDCSPCAADPSNQTGQVQPFPFCAACPAGQFAWNIADGAQSACTREDATSLAQTSNANCSVEPTLARNFDVCVQCPAGASRVPVRACTESEAVDIAKVAAASGCTVAKCP